MFLVFKSFLNYSNGHSDLHFLTLTAKNVYIVNIIISKNRIFGFRYFSSVFRYFSVFSIPTSVSVSVF